MITGPIRQDGPIDHIVKKAGTPTMGGVIIIIGITSSTLLWADLKNIYVWTLLFVSLSLGGLGLLDDVLKIKLKNSSGLKSSYKLSGQLIIGILALIILIKYSNHEYLYDLYFPFFQKFDLAHGSIFYSFWYICNYWGFQCCEFNRWIGWFSNCSCNVSCIIIYAYFICSWKYNFSEYLQIQYIPDVGELSIFCGSIVGSCLGFLWYNAPPAKIFMGDTGSLSLGGSLAAVAIIVKHEIVLAIIGGLFVLETVSVIIQVISFKLTGKEFLKWLQFIIILKKKVGQSQQ